MGTPDFAVPPLRTLIAHPDFEVVGVVTQPDRPAGRGNKIQQSPVKVAATEANIPVLQPEKLRAPGVFEQLQAMRPDVIVVAAFGQILRQNVLDLPPHGCVNIHASLLPRWRGAAPIQAAIRAGDAETGITIMRMDAGLDTGPMLRKRAIPIAADETGASLHDKLAAIGGALLMETLPAYLRGEVPPESQVDADHTYAPMLKKEDGKIDWSRPATEIERTIRAFFPAPGTFTTWNGQILKILPGGSVIPGSADPGVVQRVGDPVAVGTGDGLLMLHTVQMPGKSPAPIRAFVNGYGAFIGATLV
jgi:methionyl-tRNA formyltransferase